MKEESGAAGAGLAVAAVQMVSGADWPSNAAAAAEGIARAAGQGARLVALPEYFCLLGRRDTDKLALREAPGRGPIQDFLAEQARRHGVWLAGGTLPLDSGDDTRIYNSCLVYDPEGRPAARYDKIHLFSFSRGEESYDESRSIVAGAGPAQVVEIDGLRVGLSICYDLRFPELYRAMAPVDLILVPAAFTYTTGQAHWRLLLRARAVENQCYVLGAAQGGRHENGRRTWGESMLVDPWGEVLDHLPEGAGVVAGSVDPARLAEVRAALPALRHRVL